jgi:hypothetical protein
MGRELRRSIILVPFDYFWTISAGFCQTADGCRKFEPPAETLRSDFCGESQTLTAARQESGVSWLPLLLSRDVCHARTSRVVTERRRAWKGDVSVVRMALSGWRSSDSI